MINRAAILSLFVLTATSCSTPKDAAPVAAPTTAASASAASADTPVVVTEETKRAAAEFVSLEARQQFLVRGFLARPGVSEAIDSATGSWLTAPAEFQLSDEKYRPLNEREPPSQLVVFLRVCAEIGRGRSLISASAPEAVKSFFAQAETVKTCTALYESEQYIQGCYDAILRQRPDAVAICRKDLES